MKRKSNNTFRENNDIFVNTTIVQRQIFVSVRHRRYAAFVVLSARTEKRLAAWPIAIVSLKACKTNAIVHFKFSWQLI